MTSTQLYLAMFVFGFIIGAILVYSLGLASSAYQVEVAEKCMDTLYDTCLTTNEIINTANLQSGLIEKCTSDNITRLTKLDCEVLR